jgi:hypothetical protein
MNKGNLIIEQFKKQLRTDKPLQYENILILPVTEPAYEKPDYISSDEAFKLGCLQIKEVSESGSVPHLLAVNKCNRKVLLPEGEEVKGAKQNRTFNTSILLKENSETVIPVSCTEQGRWRYHKETFDPTDSWIPSEMRMKKIRSVSRSAFINKNYFSNQREVWDEVHRYENLIGFRSQTNALRDVLNAKKKDFDKITGHFPLVDNQTGLAVFIDGKLKGMDVITNHKVFKQLYPKILKSYLTDAILFRKIKSSAGLLDLDMQVNFDAEKAKEKLEHLLEIALMGKLFMSKSPGLGDDIRIESTQINGFALAYDDKIVHMTLFRNIK